MARPKQECSVAGCGRVHVANGYCRMHYTRVKRRGEVGPPDRTTPTSRQVCAFDGCAKWVESHGWCATHWRRIQKHGDVTIVLRGGKPRSGRRYVMKNGYINVYAPEHPLVANRKSGQVLEHRIVLYDTIGAGSHPCHSCGRTVSWFAESAKDRLEVDHLDGVRSNNSPENLAATCPKCNDGQSRRRLTACGRGHEYTAETTRLSAKGHRRCLICERETEARRSPRSKKR